MLFSTLGGRGLEVIAGPIDQNYPAYFLQLTSSALHPDLHLVIRSRRGRRYPISADPVRVDSKHYTVEAENDRVRVLRVRYGPHEKSVMHGHPALVAVFLTESRGKFTFPDGRTEERSWKVGETLLMPAENHLPENLSDNPLELVLIELK